MGKNLDDIIIPEGLRYRAFLSYRSADKNQAEWLHKKLERYRVPCGLVGKLGDFGEIPPRVGRIFRDRDEARTATDIETVIADELARSQHLVVLCTPRAAEREAWVGREIQLFSEQRPSNHIHAVIGDGEPPDCFPNELISKKPDGSLVLPLAADLRPKSRGGQDGKHKALVKIIAALIGVKFDDLWKRDKRRRMLQAAVITCLATIITTGIVITITAAQTMRKIDQYMAISTEAVDTHRWDLAALAAAVAVHQGSWLGPFRSKQAEHRLRDLRSTGKTTTIMLGHKKSLTSAVLNAEEKVVFTSALDGRVFAWNIDHDFPGLVERQQLHKFIGRARNLQLSRDGQRLVGYAGSRVAKLNTETNSLVTQLDIGSTIKSMCLVRGDKELVLGLIDGRVLLLFGESLEHQQILIEGVSSVESLATNDTGNRLALGDVEGNLYLIDLAANTISPRQIAKPEDGSVNHLVFDPSGAFVIASIGDSATVYDWSNGDALTWFTLDEYTVHYSEISPSGKYGLSLMSRDVLAIWTFSDGEPLRELLVPGCEDKDPFAYKCRVSVALFLPNTNVKPGRVMAGYWDGSIRIWSIQGEQIGRLSGHVARVSALVLSGDGQHVLSGSEDRSVRYWSLSSASRNSEPDLKEFCRKTDPSLLEVSPLTLGVPLNFNSILDTSTFDGVALNNLLSEVSLKSPCDRYITQ